ncbi:MAG: glycosyltransferase family 39 protein [Candidatus Omnitrophota bacterium]
MFSVFSPEILRRHIFWIFIFMAAVTAASLSFNSVIEQPFNLDEVEESTMGRKFSRIGPRTFLDVPEGGQQISHPLLYTFSHAAVQKVFGSGEAPLRIYGVFHYLASLLLVFLIARKLMGTDTFEGRAGIAVSGILFISNPLLVQHSVIINADNNILTTMMLVFVYFFVSYEKTSSNGPRNLVISRLKLGIIFALCLWSKIIAPVLMLAGIIFCRLFGRRPDKLLADILGIAVFGTALFWSTWYVYCFLTGTDVLAFVEFTLIGKGSIAFSARNIDIIGRTLLTSFRWPVYWVSAPFFVLIAAFTAERIYRFIKDKKSGLIDMILSAALFIWIPYQFFKPSMDMMKYQYPAYPVFFIIVGYAISKLVGRAGRGNIFFWGKASALFIPACMLLFYHYFKLGDYLLALWRPMSSFLNGHFLVYYYFPVLLAVILVLMASRKGARAANTAVTLVIFVVVINSALLVNQAKADYITAEVYQNYGERGFKETVEYLKDRVRPETVVASRADIAYYLKKGGTSFKDSTATTALMRISTVNDLRYAFSDPDLGYVILDQVISPVRFGQERMAILSEYFKLERQIGSFYIFRKK